MSSLRVTLGRVRAAIESPDGPPLAWTLRDYRPERLTGDVVAGLTVAALIVPLSIGYATVAGLPPEMGLYASILPLIAYAVFGSGRRVILGPDAASASMIAATIAPLAAVSDDRVRLASALGLLVAGIFVAMRLARMGFLADFLSRPILVGYMAGVGITVSVGQVEKLLGGPAIGDALAVLGRIDWTAANLAAVGQATWTAATTSGADLPSAALGVGVFGTIVLGRRFAPAIPMALPAMIVALVLSAVLDLQSHGVAVLGPVAGGLPPVRIPAADLHELLALLPGALGIAILTFADTTATGRSFATRAGERTDANRELVALAAADAAGALTGGYPVSSSPSRTAAAEGAGSSSGLAGIVAAAAVLVVLVLLTGPLSSLPIPALGAVILASVLGIIDVPAMLGIVRVKRSEGAIALVAMVGVILYGTLVGVVIAVLLAALNIVRRAAAPPIVEEVRLPDGSWRDIARRGDGARVAGVVTVRFAGPLFFANATALGARVRELVSARADIAAVVLDLGATSTVDLTAAEAIRDLDRELRRDGRRLVVARPLGHVRDELRIFGLGELMEATHGTHGSVDAAITGLGLDPARSADRDGIAPAAAAPGDGSVSASAGGPRPDNRFVLRVLAAAGGVVIAAAILGAVVTAAGGGALGGPSVVPNLVGMSLTRAGVAASDAGFVLIAPIYVRRDDRPEGTVVGQDPPPGTAAEAGSGVQPLVSTGRQLVSVPDVVGQPESAAILALTSAGLQVRRSAIVSDPVAPAGQVLATDPPAGTSIAAGATVGYTVSSGPPPAPSPTSVPSGLPTLPSAAPSGGPGSSPIAAPSPVATPTGVPPATPGPPTTPPSDAPASELPSDAASPPGGSGPSVSPSGGSPPAAPSP